jgi:hypothetical protein
MASCDILGTVKENDRLTTPQTTYHALRWKSIALPPEHVPGDFCWNHFIRFAGCPIISWCDDGACGVGAFLMRHPLKIAFTDWRRGKRYARTKTAEQFIAGYGLLALVGLVARDNACRY